MPSVNDVASATTFLFVPGNRPERFDKALKAGPDLVIIDLEDAVSDDEKSVARNATLAALAGNGVSPDFAALVRIGAPSDVDALCREPLERLGGIVIPKAEDPQQLAAMSEALPTNLGVIALIETALGLANVRDLAEVPRVTRLAFGAIDFSTDLGATDESVLDFARAQLVVASRAARISAPVDSPTVTFSDVELVERESRRASARGFGGKLCIHPSQIEPVRLGFTPTPDDVAWAEKIVTFAGGAVQVDGAMVDKPVVVRAEQILARARRGSP